MADDSKVLKSIQSTLDNLPQNLNDMRSETKGLMDNILQKLQKVKDVTDELVISQTASWGGLSDDLITLDDSIADNLTSLTAQVKQDVEEILIKDKKTLSIPVTGPSSKHDHVGKECIDALLKKTVTMATNKTNYSRARVYYEKLYSVGGVVSSVMEYLRFQQDAKIMIDFESDGIGRFRSSIKDHDGKDRNGSDVTAHADFKDHVVFLSIENNSENWVLVQLAHKMTQLAVSMAFQNGGSPYDKGDTVHQNQFREILAEAERKNTDHEVLDISLVMALERTEMLAKEIYLLSSVPWIFVEYGIAGGARKLQEQLPTLLVYYEEHVMPKLHAESN